MSFDLGVLDLNGSYVVDPTRTDSMEELMRLQGVGWATRKIAAKFAGSMALTINYDETKFVQTYQASVKTQIVEIPLNANNTEWTDGSVGIKCLITVSFEQDGKVLKIVAVAPKKFERSVTWERIDDRTIKNVIHIKTTDGSNQQTTVTRHFVRA